MIVAAAAVAALPAHQSYGNIPNLQRLENLPDFAALQAAIANARTVADFGRIYDSASFQMCLRFMYVHRETEDIDQWAHDWAKRNLPQERLATDVLLDH
jgi:hypothetical protein